MKARGDDYERRAGRWLQRRGLHLLARNFRARGGEIDLVCLHGDTLVFVEVRARSHPEFAGAAASVDRRKQQRLLRAAACYLQRHPELGDRPCRFDVLAFEPPQSRASGEPRWLRAAFTA